MHTKTIHQIIRASIRTLISNEDLDRLIELGKEVPNNGFIVETGCCFGGSTAALALAAPTAQVVVIDLFCWQPVNEHVYGNLPANTPEVVRARWDKLGIPKTQILLMVGDSKILGPHISGEFDLVFIDGGHEYADAYADLVNLGSKSKVIAIHDYTNGHLPQIQRAVVDFMNKFPGWDITFQGDKGDGSMAILRKI